MALWGGLKWGGRALNWALTGFFGYSEISEGKFPIATIGMIMGQGLHGALNSRGFAARKGFSFSETKNRWQAILGQQRRRTALAMRGGRFRSAAARALASGNVSSIENKIAFSSLARSYEGTANLLLALPMAGAGLSLTSSLVSGAMTRTPAQELLSTQQFVLPQAAYTMRQRALQAIHMSQTSTRASFGGEAEYLHS